MPSSAFSEIAGRMHTVDGSLLALLYFFPGQFSQMIIDVGSSQRGLRMPESEHGRRYGSEGATSAMFTHSLHVSHVRGRDTVMGSFVAFARSYIYNNIVGMICTSLSTRC